MPGFPKRAAVRASAVVRGLHQTRGPWLVSVASCTALAVLPQAREIFRCLALEPSIQSGVLAATGATLLMLIIGIWILCWTAESESTSRIFRRVAAALCAALPAIGFVIGILRAGHEFGPIGLGQPTGVVDPAIVAALRQTDALPNVLRTAAVAVAIGSGFAILLLDIIVSRFIVSRIALRWVVLPVGFAGLALGIALATKPAHLPVLFGALALFLSFMLALAVVATGLFTVRDRSGIPAFSLLLLLAVMFSWLNLSDNHVPPIVKRSQDQASKEPLVVVPTASALQSWLDARGDKGYFENRKQPYPVFIVSAEGGGQYAADLTATFLARAQDRCPNFAQHIFAISAVSGGAIGAGVFSALSKEFARNTTWEECKFGDIGVGPFETKIKAILNRDFLSPLVAATLFGDVPNAVLPFLRPNIDRAQAFDKALEAAWDEALPGRNNPLRNSYFSLWDPKGAAPAVLANTTQVENGMRVVVAPFMSMDSPMEAGTLHQRSRRTVYIGTQLLDEGWEALKPEEDISLSTAIGLSARFPWVMPAARFKTSKTEFRLVDGAYLDNSGDETAFDLIMELGQLDAMRGKLTAGSEVPQYQFHLITLTDDVAPTPGAVQGFGDVLSPIRTMLSSRPTRSQMAKHRVRAFVNRSPELTIGTEGDFSSPTPWVQMNHQEFHIPLTWQLSEVSRNLIAVQAGEAHRCELGGIFEVVQPDPTTSYEQSKAFEHINDLLRDNNCVACSIAYRLSGNKPKTVKACAQH